MSFEPCMCGDTDCPWCGTAQGTYQDPHPQVPFDLELTMDELQRHGIRSIDWWVSEQIHSIFPDYEITDLDWTPRIDTITGRLVVQVEINKFNELDWNPLSPSRVDRQARRVGQARPDLTEE